ncbi:N-acetylgalactosamine-6-sulfatase [Actinocatenispora thailandica]|uniref:N-acetylgalactosamine-6-sulfatase n=1 Tax=Actinocatenispora thailandica TaxID=227318 RepID=A0A7R7DT27_9ACTN|nr:sulfatase-like hydrolase/transferase [Actinocatenispora thailandica]BCJ37231.1 N-acetylgalactosamine-6-sulfatase [Actinocatenispora thailandica]
MNDTPSENDMPDAARPNVLVLYADDLGRGDVGCFGADDIPTPHLDRLCASGVRLSQWYSNSPVCSPSRAALLTGRYPAHAGVETILGGTRRTPGLPRQETLATQLRRRGYRTGIFGKWHLGVAPEYSPAHFGFDESFGFRAGCVDYYSHIYYWGDHNPVHDLWDGDQEVWLNGDYLTTVIGERASRFVARDVERPFFCYVPFNAPHYPLHAPPEYLERFRHLADGRHTMAAMISAMDDAIGQILDTLDRCGLRENTLVFFSSDNGPSAESRNWLDGEEVSYTGGSTGGLRGTKGSVFEGGIRVPSILSWPRGLPAGVDHGGVGLMMDVLPTVLDAVDGAPADLAGVDGRSQLARLRRPTGTPDERAVCWAHDGQWAVRRGRYKRVHDAQEGMTPPAAVHRALFDLVEDSAETTDVAGDFPGVADELDRELAAFQAQHAAWHGAGNRTAR